ncbi:MAG: IS110 family transposase [Chitinophagaceae bacterium]|nr:IS110 family transposase [Chitinophagaceae bacterium]
MKITNIMGVDVSKHTLDCHLFVQQQSLSSVSNDSKGFKSISRWLHKELKNTEGLLVVMEYTGIYTYGIERYLEQQQIKFVKRPALDIKRSLGMVRGKSDKVDARFISKYGWMRREELQPMTPLSDAQLELQQIMNHRDKLVTDKASYQCKLHELVSQMGEKVNEKMVASMKYVIEVLTQEVKEAETAIKEAMCLDQSLQTNYELASSVTGIGFATAVHLLIATENFTRFSDVRKLICYCGVAPFEHSSGISIRGKTRVSHLANKKLKSLLTMAALSAIQHDPELKAKYDQKVKEGKPKMSVLNIIRAKLIERVYAVIKKQKVYEVKLAA